VEDLKE